MERVMRVGASAILLVAPKPRPAVSAAEKTPPPHLTSSKLGDGIAAAVEDLDGVRQAGLVDTRWANEPGGAGLGLGLEIIRRLAHPSHPTHRPRNERHDVVRCRPVNVGDTATATQERSV